MDPWFYATLDNKRKSKKEYLEDRKRRSDEQTERMKRSVERIWEVSREIDRKTRKRRNKKKDF